MFSKESYAFQEKGLGLVLSKTVRNVMKLLIELRNNGAWTSNKNAAFVWLVMIRNAECG